MKKRKISLIIIAIAMALCMALFLILPACSGGGETETPPVTEDPSGGDEELNEGDGSEEHTEHSFTVLVSDETGHWYKCSECYEIDDDTFAAHSSTDKDGNTTYDSDGTQHWEICAVCEYVIGEKENCTTEETSYQSDRNSHWHTCKVCGGHVDEGAHDTSGDDGACSICGYVQEELASTTVYMVGDSTMCSFNDAYYYPRYGYGTQFDNYLDEKATVVNLAVSGRSSLSFLAEDNYTTLTSNISEGDYLIIGFGHNDETYDDETRFTSPELDAVGEEGSFQYTLYNNYIKIATDAKATPILCTPIVRANENDNYSGNSGHVVSGYGDYSACIRDLAEDQGVTCVDLTELTKAKYTEIKYSEAIYYHAWRTSDSASVDNTHLNIYGAKEVAYMLATELAKSSCSLGDYVLNGITEPTKDGDLIVNPDYSEAHAETPDFTSSYWQGKALGSYLNVDWYKTAFGNLGTDDAYSTSVGYQGSLDASEGKITVGQTGSSARGGVGGSTDGLAYVFTPLEGNQEFKIEATATVTYAGNSGVEGTVATAQEGFGIMLRDDIYEETRTNDSNHPEIDPINTNYVASGVNITSSKNNVIFSKVYAGIDNSGNTLSSPYTAGDTATITLERTGKSQTVNCTFVYGGTEYTYTYYDFDFESSDYQGTYLCFFAARGTVVEFTNITLEVGEVKFA